MSKIKLAKRVSLAFALLRGKNSTLAEPSEELLEAFGIGPTVSGVKVTEKTAMTLSAVWACVRLGAETISTIPVHLMRRKENGGSEVITDHPVAQVLGQPNPEMPTVVFFETLQGSLELRGKAFAEIVHTKDGYPKELWPVHPDHIMVRRNARKTLEYVYLPTGQVIPAWKMLHIIGFGSDGLNSYSPISLARESIGLGLAAQEFGGRYFGEGTNIGGFVEHPQKLSDAAFDRLKAEMNQRYKGLQKSHGLIILEEGMKYQKIGLSPEDSQFLQTREFQVTEIARWFGMKPHMIGDLSKATFSNIEHQGMEAVKYTWRPRAIRLEQHLNWKLLMPWQRGDFYIRMNLEGLLRGDIKSRYEAYNSAIGNGWMNANEARSKEDLPPEANGNEFFVPANWVPKERAIKSPPTPKKERNDA